MLNSFFGLHMGLRALDYFRRKMEVASHNVARADDENYSRQRVEAKSAPPFTDPSLNRPALPGQIGTGVLVSRIARLRDVFLDAQYRDSMNSQHFWSAVDEALSRVEMLIKEPKDRGLQDVLDAYWSALQELSKSPESLAVRQSLVQTSKNMALFVRDLGKGLKGYREDLNLQLELYAQEANSILERIAQLNRRISQAQALGDNPNDLMDERDALIDRLSQLMDCKTQVACAPSGEFTVFLDDKAIVQGERVRKLVLVKNPGNGGFFDVQLEDNLYDISSNPSVVAVTFEQRVSRAYASVEVFRLATQTRYLVGNARTSEQLRVRDPDEALGLSGKLALQVGNGPTRLSGRALPGGVVLGAGSPGEVYSFALRAGGRSSVVEVSWNGTAWEVRVDGVLQGTSAGATLTASDLASRLASSPLGSSFLFYSQGGALSVQSLEGHLISLYDLREGPQGGLASILGIRTTFPEDGPPVEIWVEEGDSLWTIANRINEAYSQVLPMGEAPTRWLRAEVAFDEEEGYYYLRLQSHEVGENYRIHVLPQSCNLLAMRLGLLGADGLAHELQRSEDAYFSVDGFGYLSSFNRFVEARPLFAEDGFSASTYRVVREGVTFELNGIGRALIQRHAFVKGGLIAGLLEARDDYIPFYQRLLDEMSYEMALWVNAGHASGHGLGANAGRTGTLFFEQMVSLFGASTSLSVDADLERDPTLLAAASGREGRSLGSGDGSNALALAQLKMRKVLQGGTADFNEFGKNLLAKLGIESQNASFMLENQKALSGSIKRKRQEVMGVNVDEEMVSIVVAQQSFAAMARFMTAVDEMLDKVINGMGLVGR